MPYNPDRHHRRSIRLSGYDYAQCGAYFVTLCTKKRLPLFGHLRRDAIQLSSVGLIVEQEWLRTPSARSGIDLDTFVVMPDHLHGIIIFLHDATPSTPPGIFRSPARTLGALIRGFKSAVTHQLAASGHTTGESIWQRNYYEHIIRNEADLQRIRNYIEGNPARWHNR